MDGTRKHLKSWCLTWLKRYVRTWRLKTQAKTRILQLRQPEQLTTKTLDQQD
jgi:hypothetical protein